MTFHRMLFGCLFALAGCVQPATPTTESSTDEALVTRLPPATDNGAPRPCVAVVCSADGTCPTCNGVTPDCDANNGCHYVTGGGGGGGGGGPRPPDEPNVTSAQ